MYGGLLGETNSPFTDQGVHSREHPISVADSQGQVAHTRGSGEMVAASPSDEEQMAIIFLSAGYKQPRNERREARVLLTPPVL